MTDRGLEAKYHSFLVDVLHAESVPHGNRSLYAHLAGTHALLRSWGNPMDVCLAGLFHSVYGTVRFRTATLRFSQRQRLRDLIGIRAETLAYWFCVTDRPLGLISQWDRPDIVIADRYLLDLVVLSRQELLWLLEIEAANLLEQRDEARHLLDRLADLPISAAARAALHNERLRRAETAEERASA